MLKATKEILENIGIENLLEVQKKIFDIVEILKLRHISIPCNKGKDEIAQIIDSKIRELM